MLQFCVRFSFPHALLVHPSTYDASGSSSLLYFLLLDTPFGTKNTIIVGSALISSLELKLFNPEAMKNTES